MIRHAMGGAPGRFLLAVLGEGGSALDAPALARRYGDEGLDVRVLPATKRASPDSVRSSPTPDGGSHAGNAPGSRSHW